MAAASRSWPTTTCSNSSATSWMSATMTSLFAARSIKVTTLLTLLFIWDCASSREVKPGLKLNDFINHFEPLYYEHDHVRTQHERLRRSIDDTIRFQFHAHNRRFKIRLHPSSQHIFTDDVVLENTDGPINVATDNIYSGTLEDDDQSEVHGIITKDGVFDGTISTATEDYYVEPSSRYAPELSTLLTSHKGNGSYFPAVIYKASDVTPPWQLSSSAPHCASHELFLKRRENIYNHCQDISECEETLSRSPPRANLNHTSTSSVISRRYRREQRHQKQYSASHSRVIDREWNSNETIQGRRTAGRSFQRRSTIDPKKVTCMLYLQADHLFYQKLGSEEACIESMTRHVQRVNAIYKNIDFNGDGRPDGLTFMIKRIKVHTEKALEDVGYRFPGNYGVEKFLELFSEEDYDAFCLAYMFTYRDFEGGTLGLAWTGDLKNAGGVCEKNGHYRGSLKSLNTGIVTLLNYGKHVPPAVSHVTLAHEIGHNFGSPHDPENNKECTPGGEDGNYIMFARATSGDKKNNNKFSPCSLKSINSVLNSKARDAKGCFTEPQTAICGNGVVELGEECDCGWEEDCRESCCYPMRTSPLPGETPCTLRPYRVCSPSQGPCCTHDCRLKAGVKCRDDNGCRDSSFCDGRGPACPPSNNKPNKTICNEEFVCFMGECTGSICIAYGLESCQCSQGPSDPQTKSCELCCKLPGDDQPCLSSFEWNAVPYDVPDMHAKPGTPCNNYNGYCDVFQRCREVDPSGPLATLRRLLLSDESIASLKKWVEEHWYGVLFIAVGFIVLMVVIVRLFGKKHSKTSRVRRVSRRRPAKQQAPNISNGAAGGAAEPEVDANGHIVHPAVVRPYLPFKKKVREKAGRGRSAHTSHAKGVAKASRSARVLHRLLGRPSPAKVPVRQSSGAISSTEKVKSWLEREDAAPIGGKHSQSARKVTHPNSAPGPQSSPTEPLTTVPIDEEARNGSAPKPKGIGRSISENPQRTSSARFEGTSHGTHKTGSTLPAFRRSQSHMAKSQSYNPNPGNILRKSESQSRLIMSRSRSLSASQSQSPEVNQAGSTRDLTFQNAEELESDIETFNPPSLTRMESQVQLLSPSTDELPRKRKSSSQSCKTSVLPTSHPEPQVSLPKSATDSKLKAITSAAAFRSTMGGTKRASSLEVLNVFKFKANLRSASGTMQNQPPQAKPSQKKDTTKRKGEGTTLGLGPVRVVLKWHGKSSAGARRKKPNASSNSDGKKKRQVIVYSNPKPTLGDKSKMRTKTASQDKEVSREQKGGSQGESTRKLIRIAENPLDRHDLVNPGYTASPEPERSHKISSSALRGTPSDSSSGHISIHIDAELENVDC